MKRRGMKFVSTRLVLSFLLASTLFFTMSAPLSQQAYATTMPTAVDGRILTPAQTGDCVNWVEIARCGNYSLIVRSSYINIYSQMRNYGDPAWQYISYGATSYSSSNVRTFINKWFNGLSFAGGDKLPANARLRNYTMRNNALQVTGTASTVASQTNGFSTPSSVAASCGDDVAFALSFSEVMNFVSKSFFQRERSPQSATSSAIARANYAKICIPQIWVYGMWTRSPGDISSTAGALDYTGRVFQFQHSDANEHGLLYPALWVDSSIWGPTTATVNVVHKDSQTGTVLGSNSYTLNAPQTVNYGPYNAQNFAGYQAGVLASYSDPPSGTINPGATKTVTWLYSPAMQNATVIVNHVNAQTGALLQNYSYPMSINQPTSYGPYNAQTFGGFDAGVLASYSDPPSGTINPGATKTITWLYNPMMQAAIVVVNHIDAQTGAVLLNNNYLLSINQPTNYGPYDAQSFPGYQAGVLATYSDPPAGTINPGTAKIVTWTYRRIPINT